ERRGVVGLCEVVHCYWLLGEVSRVAVGPARPAGDASSSPTVPAFVRHPSRLVSATDLARRVRDGDAGALEALFREHYGALCRFANRYLHDRAAAEDLVQDVFTSIWSGRLRLEVQG